jgi:hypothetical protein
MTASTTSNANSAASVPAVPAFKKKEPLPDATVKVRIQYGSSDARSGTNCLLW